MITMKFVPSKDKEPEVKGERIYDAFVSGRSGYEKLGLKVRARNAAHAEEKLLFCFKLELKGKLLDFDPGKIQLPTEEGPAGSTPAQAAPGEQLPREDERGVSA